MEITQTLVLSIIADIIYCIIIPTFYANTIRLNIRKSRYIIAMSAIFTVLTPIQYILEIPHLAVYLSCLLINVVSVIIFSNERFLKRIICAFIPNIVDIAVSMIYIAFRTALMPGWQSKFGSKEYLDFFEAVIITLGNVLALFIISKLIRRKKAEMNDLTAIYLLSIIIMHMFVMTFVMYVYNTRVNLNTFYAVLLAYMVISVSLMVLVILINSRINRKQRKQDLIASQYQFMSSQYDDLRNNYIVYKKLRHDLKEHMNVVLALALKGQTDELQTYTDTLRNNWEALSSKTFCDVPAVDIIISDKYNAAVSSDIKTDFIVSGIKEANADSVYLCSIFANLLNNAIEAASCCCSSEPFINLRCGIIMEQLTITCSNCMPDTQKEKDDPDNHGYGMKIINDTAKLLGGSFSHEHNDKVFTAVVTIPVKRGKQ